MSLDVEDGGTVDRHAAGDVKGALEGTGSLTGTAPRRGCPHPTTPITSAAPELTVESARQVLEGAGWVQGDGEFRQKDGRELQLDDLTWLPRDEVETPLTRGAA